MSTRYHTLRIPTEYLVKRTDKAYCFQFTDGKRRYVPISQTHNLTNADGIITFQVADWVIRERHLREWIVNEPPTKEANDYVN